MATLRGEAAWNYAKLVKALDNVAYHGKNCNACTKHAKCSEMRTLEAKADELR